MGHYSKGKDHPVWLHIDWIQAFTNENIIVFLWLRLFDSYAHTMHLILRLVIFRVYTGFLWHLLFTTLCYIFVQFHCNERTVMTRKTLADHSHPKYVSDIESFALEDQLWNSIYKSHGHCTMMTKRCRRKIECNKIATRLLQSSPSVCVACPSPVQLQSHIE